MSEDMNEKINREKNRRFEKMLFRYPVDMKEPEQIRNYFKPRLEAYFRKHRRTPKFKQEMLDLMVTKTLDYQKPNRILEHKSDIVHKEFKQIQEKMLKESLEYAKHDGNTRLERYIKQELRKLAHYQKTTWIHYERPCYCTIGFCRNKSEWVLTENMDGVFDENHIYAKCCPKHAKFMRLFHSARWRKIPSKQENVKEQLEHAEFEKKLRDLGFDVRHK